MDIRLGACDWALPGGGLFAARIAAQAGLTGLALDLGGYERGYPLCEPAMQRWYREEGRACGVEYIALALNDLNRLCICAPDGSAEAARIDGLLGRALSTAAALEIPVIQLPLFQASSVRTPRELDRLVRRLRPFCRACAAAGVTPAVESILPPETLRATVRAVENLRIYFDTQNHIFFSGIKQVEALEALYDLIVPQIHVKDGKTHACGSLLGTGDADFAGTIGLLRQKGYRGYLVLENNYDQIPLRLEADSPYELLLRDVQTLRLCCKE